MRKTLFTLAGLLVTIITNAYTCVTFNSGDPTILLKEAYISYEFDWDHARVTNHDNLLWNDYLRKRGDDFVKDWPKDRKKVEEYFTIRFNKKSDFLQIKDKSPVYKMIVRPKTIDVGNGSVGGAFFHHTYSNHRFARDSIEHRTSDSESGLSVCPSTQKDQQTTEEQSLPYPDSYSFQTHKQKMFSY